MPVNLYDSRTMGVATKQVKRPFMFLRKSFFTKETTFDSEWIDLDIKKGKRRLAPFVRPTDRAKLIQEIGYQTRQYRPPYIKEKMIDTSEKLLKRQMGQPLHGGTPRGAVLAGARLREQIEDLSELIDRRIETMVAEAIRTGKVTVVGEQISETIDFLMTAAHIITLSGAALWSNSASDPLKDIRTWKRLIVQATGRVPNTLIMGDGVYDNLLTHADFRTLMDNRRIAVGDLAERTEGAATQVGRVHGIDLFTYDEWYIDPVDDAEKQMIPTDRIILGCPGAATSNQLLYGAIEDNEALVNTRVFTKSWTKPDPSKRFLMLQSAPLPGMNEPDCFVSVKAI